MSIITNQNYKTIFSQPQPSPQSPPANHPLFYYSTRNTFLSQLSNRYSSKYQLPTMDLKRNAKVNYYLDRYEGVKREIRREEERDRCYLGVEEFQTVFGEVIGERRERNRERREEERLRKDLHDFYMHQEQVHQQPEHDSPNHNPKPQTPQYETILTDYRTDPQKQKQLYLLDLQLGKLHFQQNLQKKVQKNHETCRNEHLLSKLSNNILSAYMVHFDQIYNELIDQILVEEVYYLNYLEAEYHVQKEQWKRGKNYRDGDGEGEGGREDRERFENARTIKMMELVKGLEDLCDQ